MGETSNRSGFAALVREPLLLFLVLGGLLFGLVEWLSPGPSTYVAPDRLVKVSAERIQALRSVWEKRWQRPPTERELRGVVESVVREEILAREALALGLDRDDPVVRRRLAQKMGFLVRDLAPPREPTDDEMRGFLEEHAERYRVPAQLGFTQVFFSPDRRVDRAEADAKAALEKLAAEPDLDPETLGDSIMLGQVHQGVSERDVARQFGEAFAASLAKLPVGRWSGPVGSAYGLHVVRVHQREDGGAPDLDAVRDAVRRDLLAKRREETEQIFHEKLRSMYRVEIDEAALSAAVASPRGGAR
jgi:peptidyl-prolyl cis-trans isomerase C